MILRIMPITELRKEVLDCQECKMYSTPHFIHPTAGVYPCNSCGRWWNEKRKLKEVQNQGHKFFNLGILFHKDPNRIIEENGRAMEGRI